MAEEANEALNNQVEEDVNQTSSPEVESKATEEVEQIEPAGEVEATETDGKSKKGFSNRVRELDSRAKVAEERANALEARIAELTAQSSTSGYTPQYNPQEPIIKPGEEIDGAELNKRLSERESRILQVAEAKSELKQRQSEAIGRINTETNEVIRAYPELDPDSESYNKELSESITEATMAYVKNSPYSASVKTFVSKLMKPYKGAVSKGVGEATETIARQVSESALKPTTVRKPDKTAADKSLAELEAELGVVQA